MNNAGTVSVAICMPDSVREALRDVHVLAQTDDLARRRLRQWIEGVNGPVLFARGLHRNPTTGALHATLEFTDGFRDFLAALRTGDGDRHVG